MREFRIHYKTKGGESIWTGRSTFTGGELPKSDVETLGCGSSQNVTNYEFVEVYQS